MNGSLAILPVGTNILIWGGKKEKCEVAASVTYVSFLVRMWQERSLNPPETMPDWHGEVEHIQSGRHRTFSSLGELLDFFRHVAENIEALTSGEPHK